MWAYKNAMETETDKIKLLASFITGQSFSSEENLNNEDFKTLGLGG